MMCIPMICLLLVCLPLICLILMVVQEKGIESYDPLSYRHISKETIVAIRWDPIWAVNLAINWRATYSKDQAPKFLHYIDYHYYDADRFALPNSLISARKVHILHKGVACLHSILKLRCCLLLSQSTSRTWWLEITATTARRTIPLNHQIRRTSSALVDSAV